MNQILSRVPIKYRPFILPIFTFIFIVVISATLGKYEVETVINSKSEVDQLTQDNKILSAKSQVLSSLNITQLSDEVKTAVDAIPVQSSTLPAIATIRSTAFKNGLDLSNFSVLNQGESKNSLENSVEINVTVVGKREDIIRYLGELKSITPIIQTTSANINNNDSGARASITFISYWSPLPKTLGKSDQPIEALKKTEQDQLKILQDLKKPEGGNLVPAQPQGKENPFSL